MLRQVHKDYMRSVIRKEYNSLDEINESKKLLRKCVSDQVEKAAQIERDGVWLNPDYYFALESEIEENKYYLELLDERARELTNAENN